MRRLNDEGRGLIPPPFLFGKAPPRSVFQSVPLYTSCAAEFLPTMRLELQNGHLEYVSPVAIEPYKEAAFRQVFPFAFVLLIVQQVGE